MGIEIAEYHALADRLEMLGCKLPDAGIVLLPMNLDIVSSSAEFKNASTISTVKKLLRAEKIEFGELIGPESKLPKTHNNSFDWISPPILMTAAMILNQSDFTNVVLGIFANYATEFLRGQGNDSKVSIEVVVETKKSGTYKRVKYEGDPKGLDKLPDVIKSIANED